MNHARTWIIVMSQLTLAIAGPTHRPQFLSAYGSNIRNFPCTSTTTGETGVCMFAATCERANGSHLSTCIDRFYFGSCCKLHDDNPEVHPQENEPGSSGADGAIESNDIPDDSASPKPIDQITRRPIFENTQNTTQPTVGPSSFQTVENFSPSTTPINEGSSPSTRFPPRNATTTRPSQVTTMTSWLMTRKTTARPPQQHLTTFESSSSSTHSSSTFSTSPSTVEATEDVTPSTHPPGLITWSSYVNNEVTKTPETSTTFVATQEADNSANAESDSSLGATVPTISTTTFGNVEGLLIPTDNFDVSDYKQVCGTRLLPDSRIVGGGPSPFGKWPWQLSLRRWNISSSAFEHSCGAVLLTDNWAITAAHCVESVPWKYLVLTIGEHDMSNNDEPYESQERKVQFVFGHPLFDTASFEHDLALLRFDRRLANFQPNILPICLPEDDDYFEGSTAYVTGWGRLKHNGRVPSVMREVPVPVISNAACEGMYKRAGYKERIPNIFICAGRRKGGIDSCEGDSGGPMVIQRTSDGRWILAGIISWGIGCGAPNQPGVYTRISEFRDWIARSIELIDQAYVEAAALT